MQDIFNKNSKKLISGCNTSARIENINSNFATLEKNFILIYFYETKLGKIINVDL